MDKPEVDGLTHSLGGFGGHLFTAVKQKTTRRTVNANLWLVKDHPLNLDRLLPLLHILSFCSKQIRKLTEYLSKL